MVDKIKLKNFDFAEEYEPSDSEEEYTSNEKRLLEKVRKRRHEESGSEEELYRFSASESEENAEIADSDVEGQEDDDNLPDGKAWGKNKRIYHSTDYVDQDFGGFAGDEEQATLEEQEARVIQKRLAQQLGDEDFSLDFFTSKKISEGKSQNEEREVLIKSDLTQMSKRQKLQLLQKESPEFLGLVDDFKNKLSMAKDNLKPVLNLVKEGKIPDCSASQFVKTNYDLILNYCTNISFYLLLKAKKVNIHNHPVVKKLYQYRQMLNQMEPVYEEIIKPQIDSILVAVEKEIEIQLKSAKIISPRVETKKRKIEKNTKKNGKKLKLLVSLEGSSKDEKHDTGVSDNEDEFEDDDELSDLIETKSNGKIPPHNGALQQADLSEESGFSDSEGDGKVIPETSKEGIMEMDDGEKREITYQMAKNKGLTPHRKKEQRNPRVKHRMKYKKAKVRRKGAVREVKNEISRYGGEMSGIKANVKKSIKIKS